MESAAQLARKFIRMNTASQDLCMDIMLDFLSEARKRRLLANALLRDNQVEYNTSRQAFHVTSSEGNEQAPVAESGESQVAMVCSQASPSVDNSLTRSKPVYAFDIEYVDSVSGSRLIHSIALASRSAVSPTFMIAHLPPTIPLRTNRLLTPELQDHRQSTSHHADINTIKATVLSLADVSTFIMWDAEKDISAMSFPSRAEIIDIAPLFTRSDGSRCSLRGAYHYFFHDDIYRLGRDPRNSATAILRLFNEVVPVIDRFPWTGVMDLIASNSMLDARIHEIAAEDSCRVSRRRR